MTNREYQRGYNQGLRTAAREKDEVLRELRAMRVRAERAEAGAGYGRCDACRHWRRGVLRDGGHVCAWGTCMYTERVLDIDWPWRGRPDQTIHTKENFGCIRFEQDTVRP